MANVTDCDYGKTNFCKKDEYAIWWDGTDSWNIGFQKRLGTKLCFGFFVQDVLCPHQIKEWNGMLNYGNSGTDIPWVNAGNSLCLR